MYTPLEEEFYRVCSSEWKIGGVQDFVSRYTKEQVCSMKTLSLITLASCSHTDSKEKFDNLDYVQQDVRMLISLGVDIHQKGHWGTPTQQAAIYGKASTALLFLELGGLLDSDFVVKKCDGYLQVLIQEFLEQD